VLKEISIGGGGRNRNQHQLGLSFRRRNGGLLNKKVVENMHWPEKPSR